MKRKLKRAVLLLLVLSAGIALALNWPAIEFQMAGELDGVYVAAPDDQSTAEEIASAWRPIEPEMNFIVVGDTGTGGRGQRRVAGAMAFFAKDQRSEFVLLLGDNFYATGVESTGDRQWQSKFENMYRSRLRKLPFYAALGNHDHKGNVQAQVEYSQLSERWTMPSRYYSFTRALPSGDALEIFVIDTTPISNSEDGLDSQLLWLEEAIAASRARWKIVAGHHPLRSGGRPESATRALRKALLPVFKRAPIDLYLSGHDHYLEYGATDDGTNYAISGAGGRLEEKVIEHKRARFATKQLGFLAIRAGQQRLRLEFVGADGSTLYQYGITKDDAPDLRLAGQRGQSAAAADGSIGSAR